MPVASNMQFSLISRRMVNQLSSEGMFFRSPFPDFYATPLLFLTSKRILVLSRPMVVVGITPKSYGAFHFSSRPSEGVKFLQNSVQLESDSLQAKLLPGTSYNDSWLLAMDALRSFMRSEPGVVPNYRRYRFLQILHVYKNCYFDRKVPASDIKALWLKMSMRERLTYGLGLPICFGLLRLSHKRFGCDWWRLSGAYLVNTLSLRRFRTPIDTRIFWRSMRLSTRIMPTAKGEIDRKMDASSAGFELNRYLPDDAATC